MATIASLIVDVAANTAQLHKDVKGIETQLDSMSGFAKKAGAALGIAFSAQAVISFGKQVFDTASEINDMSTKLGISTDAVQGFKFAAEQTGSTIDAVGTAITKMSKGLVGGDKAVAGALKEVGLNIDNIRRMSPEDAFLAIADAIQKVPDPMIQSHAALTIFGKSAAELLPGMKEGFRTLADSADKMSEDTIRALDNAQDAWEKLSNKVVIVTGTVIGHALDMAKQTTSSFASFLMFADNAIKNGVGAALAMADASEKASVAAGKHKDVNLALEPVVVKTEKAVRSATKAVQEKTVATSEEVQVLALLAKAHERELSAQKFEESAFQATTKAAEIYIRTLPTAIFQTTSYAGAVAQVSEEAAKAQGNLAGVTKEVKSLHDASSQFGQGLGNAIFGAVTGGGKPLEAAGSFIGKELGTKVGSSLGEYFSREGAGKFSKALGGMFEAVMPGIGALLGPLLSKVGSAIAGLFDRNKGRDIVEEFAKGLGGFDALQKQLEALGDEGARLWVKLTQGVGKNNKDQARAAVEEVTAALEKHKTAQEAVATAAAATGVAETEAYRTAKDAVTSLDSQIKTLSDSIAGEAPEEFMGIVEQQTRARIAALSTEREAAQKSLESLTVTMTDSIDDVADAIRALPEKIVLEFEYHTRGGSGETDESSSPASFMLPSPGASAMRVSSSVSGGSQSSALAMMADQIAAQNHFMMVQVPKAIAAAIQKAAA